MRRAFRLGKVSKSFWESFTEHSVGFPVFFLLSEDLCSRPTPKVHRLTDCSETSLTTFSFSESLEQEDNNMAEDDWNHTMDNSFQSLVRYFGSLLVLLLVLEFVTDLLYLDPLLI